MHLDPTVHWAERVCYRVRLLFVGGEEDRLLPDPGPGNELLSANEAAGAASPDAPSPADQGPDPPEAPEQAAAAAADRDAAETAGVAADPAGAPAEGSGSLGGLPCSFASPRPDPAASAPALSPRKLRARPRHLPPAGADRVPGGAGVGTHGTQLGRPSGVRRRRLSRVPRRGRRRPARAADGHPGHGPLLPGHDPGPGPHVPLHRHRDGCRRSPQRESGFTPRHRRPAPVTAFCSGSAPWSARPASAAVSRSPEHIGQWSAHRMNRRHESAKAAKQDGADRGASDCPGTHLEGEGHLR